MSPADALDPLTEADALADAIRVAMLAVKAGETVDLEPLGERVRALTDTLNQSPPAEPARALAARDGLGKVVTALDALEAALDRRAAPRPPQAEL